jgi:hypothetical protein
VPHFVQVVNRLTDIDAALLTQLMTQQVTATKLVIEGVAGLKFANMYTDLHAAYASTSAFADALAKRIAQKFADKFPGDPSNREVDLRASLANLLQEHSYVTTMATNAATSKRDAESAAAMSALAANTDSLDQLLPPQLKTLWTARDKAVLAYATSGDAAAKQSLTDDFVAQLSALTRVAAATITEQVNATIKVIDDQRAQSFKTLADDDRGAAAAMQPVSDAIAFSPGLRR